MVSREIKGFPRQLMEMYAQEPMFDFVPLARGWGQMADGNLESGLRCQLLQLLFPESVARSIGTAPISEDQVRFAGGIQTLSHALPPPSGALDGELCGFMVNAHIHKAAVVDHIVDPIGDGFPIRDRAIVVDIHGGLLPFPLPFLPAVR